jgi:cytochrome c-type biogenesis protein CcmE
VKKSKVIALIILIVSFVAIGFLLFYSTRPYLTVAQVLENPSHYNNQEIEVIGIVRDFSGGDFNLTEGSYKISINTSDVSVPGDFSNGMEVVVRGIFSQSSILKAIQIITQCS